jgi:PII-like signaling protein
MALSGTARRLMVILDEDDRFEQRPLFMEIVRRARDAGLAGASVFRGIEGFGPSHHLHTSRILSLTADLPVMILIIDSAANIDRFLPELADLVVGGVIALDDVEIAGHRGSGAG